MKKLQKFFLLLIVIFVSQDLCPDLFSQDLAPVITSESTAQFIQSMLKKNRNNSVSNSIVTVLAHDGYHSRHSAPQSLYRFARCYFLILASEMQSSGFLSGEKITSLGFNYKYGTDLGTKGFFKVYFQNTNDVINTKTTNWNQAIASMTQVHEDTLTIQTQPGNFDILLNDADSFIYSGGGIYVAFEYSNPTGPLAVVSNVCWSNRALPGPILRSSQSDDSLRVIATGFSGFRPETRFGTEKTDIVTVGPVYSMGVIGIKPLVDTNKIRAVVNHTRQANDVIVVTTKVKNVISNIAKHTFIDTIISNIIESKTLSNKYVPDGSLSTDSIIVTASTTGEDIAGNNRATYLVKSTINSWNHFIPSIAPSGGVGLSVGTGDYVAKFHSSGCITICAVDLSFFAENGFGSNPYKVIIYTADGIGGLPGTLLHSSPPRISPTGATGVVKRSIYFLTNPVIVCSNYYVGYSQTDERNLRVSYQIESPIRTGELYYTTQAGSGNWTEFAEISPYRFDVSPRTFLSLKLKAYLQGFCHDVEMISDTIEIFVRSQSSPFNLIDSCKSILDTSGTGLFNFINVNSDSCYYFDVRHRNHLRTFSHVFCERLNSSPAIYDFTDLSSKAYGNNMIYVPSINFIGGFAFYGGDVNQDENVDVSDLVLIYNDASTFINGYVKTDVTGDNFVDIEDLVTTYNNSINFVNVVVP